MIVHLNLNVVITVIFFYKKGTEFKTTACTITGVLQHMEIQHGKEGMKKMQFNSAVGATAGCTLRALLGTIPRQEMDKTFGIR